MQILYEDNSLTVCIKEPGISSEDTILAARSPSAAQTRAVTAGPPAARPAPGNARSAPAAGTPATGSSPAAPAAGTPATGSSPAAPRPEAASAGAASASAASAGAAPSAAPGSVPALLRAHWGQPNAYVGVVHRLDLGVGGLMVYARTPAAAAALSRQVADRSFVKEYLCLCAGVPAPAQGQMRDYLFKDSRTRKVFPVKAARKGAKEALLDYAVLAEGTLPAAAGAPAGDAAPGETAPTPTPAAPRGSTAPAADALPSRAAAPGETVSRPPAAAPNERPAVAASVHGDAAATAPPLPGSGCAAPAAPQPIALCRVTLHTGRTHQIRVQFASRRHPLLGDGKYGSRVKGAIALQCSRLAFTHPKTGRRMEFTLPAPERWPLR